MGCIFSLIHSLTYNPTDVSTTSLSLRMLLLHTSVFASVAFSLFTVPMHVLVGVLVLHWPGGMWRFSNRAMSIPVDKTTLRKEIRVTVGALV
jgi:hypothetical protein